MDLELSLWITIVIDHIFHLLMFDDAYLTSFLCCKAGLVGLVVMRDVALVSGAVYHRVSSLGWQVTCLTRTLVAPFLYKCCMA